MHSISNGQQIGGLLQVATVVVVFLAEEEIVVVGVGEDDVLPTFFEIEEPVGGIGAIGADSGCGLGAVGVVG